MPISGTFLVFAGVMVLHFDRALEPAILDKLNWEVHQGGWAWSCAVARSGLPFANTVEGNFVKTALPAAPGTRVNYRPPPFDVTGTTGVPAAGFLNFPLT